MPWLSTSITGNLSLLPLPAAALTKHAPPHFLTSVPINFQPIQFQRVFSLFCVFSVLFPVLSEIFYTDVVTGEMGGVYHTVMSLVDSVMSVVDSWNCRKKEDCCPQCSCLVCRNPRFLWNGTYLIQIFFYFLILTLNERKSALLNICFCSAYFKQINATFLKVFLPSLVISEADPEER